MKLDNVNRPCTFYYEDEYNNKVSFDEVDKFPNKKWYAQHCKTVMMQHSVHLSSYGKDLLPVRFFKRILNSLPNSWKKDDVGHIWSSSTINSGYPIVKYLVEERKWSFTDACVFVGDCCERCLNLSLIEVGALSHPYSLSSATWCVNCKIMDSEYHRKYKMRYIYIGYFKGCDMKERYRELFLNDM